MPEENKNTEALMEQQPEVQPAEQVKEEKPAAQPEEVKPAEEKPAVQPVEAKPAKKKNKEEELTTSDLIRDLLKAQKKQLRTDRIRTVIVMLFLAGVILIGLFIFKEYKTIESTIETIKISVEAIKTDEINKAVVALTGAANSLQEIDTCDRSKSN